MKKTDTRRNDDVAIEKSVGTKPNIDQSDVRAVLKAMRFVMTHIVKNGEFPLGPSEDPTKNRRVTEAQRRWVEKKLVEHTKIEKMLALNAQPKTSRTR